MISYAQNFEDVILNRVFKAQEGGFYIDVGAWDDTIDSVTKHFYEKNWSGINIEPLPMHHANLEAKRPRDINLNIAILDTPGSVELFEIHESGLSTADVRSAMEFQENGRITTRHRVEARTLEQVCIEHVKDKQIDFLKIDTEGTEYKVLTGGNWSRFRPRVLVIEATRPGSPQTCHDEWEPFVLNSGYLFAYFDGLNRFYVRREEPQLLEHFSVPPNVFDDFALYRTVLADEVADSLRERLRSAMRKADELDRIRGTFIGRIICRIL